MNGRPIFYMDVDGVLNLFGENTLLDQHLVTRTVELPGYNPFTLTLDPRHKEMIADLSRVFEMRWASMWGRDAVDVFAPIVGYGEDWPYIQFSRYASSETMGVKHRGIIDYKIPGIVNDAQDRPFVWADDDFTLHHHQWAHQRSQTRAATRLITTQPDVGLTSADIDAVRLWTRVFA